MEMLALNVVQKLVAAAVTKAKADFHRPICVSVCDESGFLVAIARMEDAPLRSIEIPRKCYSEE
ncbi:MAG TPA: heme-binding protein [Terracidiphilus sp.]|nr:heme-binding protein [Terracidiphilus sp.]